MVEFEPGDVLRDGRYVVQRRLRSARDKSVYLGHDQKFDTRVTIDVFARNNSVMPDGLTASAWEARVLGRLGDHPNIAIVVDQWEDDQAAIMVSRYLSGGSLLDLITRSRESGQQLPVERILQIATEIAHGLAYIHGRRILYLDLQPRNVLFDERGTVHLVDFDTAVPFDQPDVSHLAGRPAVVYLAPELTDGGRQPTALICTRSGPRCMRWPLASRPFTGSREEILAARRAGPPAPVEREDLPGALRELVFCLLAADRGQRPASAAQVLEQLQGIRTTRADIEKLLASDESATLEFKSTLRTPVGPPKPGDSSTSREARTGDQARGSQISGGFSQHRRRHPHYRRRR